MVRKINRLVILTVFIGLTFASLYIIIFPNASLFFNKKPIEAAQVAPDEGFSYRYPIKTSTFLFSRKGILLIENQERLSAGSYKNIVNSGQGKFYLADSDDEGFELFFAASDNTDPRTNGKSYTILMPVVFFSRTMGFVYLFILGSLLGWFIKFIAQSRKHRQSGLVTPVSFLTALDAFVTEKLQANFYLITNRKISDKERNTIWRYLLWWTGLATFLFVGMEWLFFVTKPSFMDILGWDEKIYLFHQSAIFIAIPVLLIIFLLWGIDTLLELIKCSGLPMIIATLLPTILFSSTVLLLVDNFTYTVLNFGIVSTTGIWRFVYAIGFLLIFGKIFNRLMVTLGLRGQAAHPPVLSKPRAYTLGGLFTLSLALLLVRFDASSFIGEGVEETTGSEAQNFPNIILMGSDGLNAENMSVYGYERETTPIMDELAEASLVAENAFTNAAHSTGSVISIFTSKLPMQTRVLYPPDVLQPEDAFEHLPGILKREGYTTVELGTNHFVDAYKHNVRNGFDLVNNRNLGKDSWYQSMQGRGYDNVFYFINLISERISERLNHIFFIKEMENSFAAVTDPAENLKDKQRLERLIDLIYNSKQPFFVHVHYMATHGGKFNPRVVKFSLGKEQNEEWMTDYYDDTILAYDVYVGSVLKALEDTGKMDNTIFILYSDHGQRWQTNIRIPLMIHFPYDRNARRIHSNVQNLDIAPTILDYLGLPIPDWMGGQSLLNGEPDPNRLIFSTGARLDILHNGDLIADQVKPPFYQFTWFNVVQCDRWYLYDVPTATWKSGEVGGHTASCSPDSLLPLENINQELINQLSNSGFDVSTLTGALGK